MFPLPAEAIEDPGICCICAVVLNVSEVVRRGVFEREISPAERTRYWCCAMSRHARSGASSSRLMTRRSAAAPPTTGACWGRGKIQLRKYVFIGCPPSSDPAS